MKTKASQQYKALNQRVSSQIEYTRKRTHTQVHSFKVETASSLLSSSSS